MEDLLKYPKEDIVKDSNFDFVQFTPYIWHPGEGLGNAIQGITGVGDLEQAGGKIIEAVTALIKAAKDTAANKDAFYSTLRYVNVGSSSDPLRVVLPFSPSQIANISHGLEWRPENSVNAPFVEKAGAAINNLAQGNFKNAMGDAFEAAKIKVREYAITAMESSGIKIGNFGLAIYQPQRQMFGGVRSMSFNFDWELIPRSQEEAQIILDIIDSFRYLSYPSRLEAAGNYSEIAKAAIRQPCLWKVQFPNKGKFKDLIAKGNRFLCVITGVDFQIGQGNDQSKLFFAFDDDMPNYIKMSVKFEEYFNPLDGTDRFGEGLKAKFKPGGDINSETEFEVPKSKSK